MGSYDECSESPSYLSSEEEEEEEQTLGIGEGRRIAEEEDPWSTLGIGEGRRVAEEDPWSLKKKKKKKKQVFLEGCYVEAEDEEDQDSSKGVSRTVSLTDEDLDELKGCLDLGFGFNYEEIPELCTTLPALELCYSMSQRFTLDDQQQHKSSSTSPPKIETTTTTSSSSSSMSGSGSGGPIANWKISSPGDHPEEVKARLKFWAQTVACTVKLCT